jgi:hypothetical protein
LPDVPHDLKLLQYPFDPMRYIRRGTEETSLEKAYMRNAPLLAEPDMGVDINLIDPEAYAISSEGAPDLHPLDRELIDGQYIDEKEDAQKNASTEGQTPWLMSTQYVDPVAKATSNTRFGEGSGALAEMDPPEEEPNSRLAAVEQTFDDANQTGPPIHNVNQNLTCTEVTSLFPDFDRWGYSIAHMAFDEGALDEKRLPRSYREDMEMASQGAIIRAMTSEDTDEQWLAYYLPLGPVFVTASLVLSAAIDQYVKEPEVLKAMMKTALAKLFAVTYTDVSIDSVAPSTLKFDYTVKVPDAAMATPQTTTIKKREETAIAWASAQLESASESGSAVTVGAHTVDEGTLTVPTVSTKKRKTVDQDGEAENSATEYWRLRSYSFTRKTVDADKVGTSLFWRTEDGMRYKNADSFFRLKKRTKSSKESADVDNDENFTLDRDRLLVRRRAPTQEELDEVAVNLQKIEKPDDRFDIETTQGDGATEEDQAVNEADVSGSRHEEDAAASGGGHADTASTAPAADDDDDSDIDV